MKPKLFKLYRVSGKWPFRTKKLICTFLSGSNAQATLRKMREYEPGWMLTSPSSSPIRFDFVGIFQTLRVWL